METAEAARPTTVDPDDLAELLPDWRRRLRATNRAVSTVRRYEQDARTFLTFLPANGMPTQASALTREHLGALRRRRAEPTPPPRRAIVKTCGSRSF
ncbi:MAG: hypothetical protein LC799_03795 [Actinobacteria bacterium]|nr:hypothetical protein [Actinomycetota bacterium]